VAKQGCRWDDWARSGGGQLGLPTTAFLVAMSVQRGDLREEDDGDVGLA
jgi:hypothetical protein